MDVLLIKPYTEVSNVLPPLGLGYLSSALKKSGLSVKVINCYKEKIGIPDILKYIKEEKIKVVGVTTCSNDHFWLQKFSKSLEEFPDINLIVGGPHATGLSKRLFDLIPRIDFIVKTEGENSFPLLVDYILNNDISESSLSSIPNLVWKKTPGNAIENRIELPEDLDALALPDWNALCPSDYAKFAPHGGFAKSFPVAQIITTRGCPYSCRYCASYIMNGNKIRKRSPESIVDEIQYLIKDHGIKEIHIEDDNFTFHKDHVVNLCAEIRKRGINVNFGLPNGVRIDKLDRELITELKKTGFYFLSVGIESGSTETLKKMNKNLSLEKAKENVKLIREFGIRVKGFFMLGYPGESAKEMQETIQFACSLDINQAFFSIYIPLPGTIEFNRLEEDGIIDINKCNWEDFYTAKFNTPPYVPDGMNPDDLKKMVSYAHRKFYFRPKITFGMLGNITSFSQIEHLVKRGISLILLRKSN